MNYIVIHVLYLNALKDQRPLASTSPPRLAPLASESADEAKCTSLRPFHHTQSRAPAEKVLQQKVLQGAGIDSLLFNIIQRNYSRSSLHMAYACISSDPVQEHFTLGLSRSTVQIYRAADLPPNHKAEKSRMLYAMGPNSMIMIMII